MAHWGPGERQVWGTGLLQGGRCLHFPAGAVGAGLQFTAREHRAIRPDRSDGVPHSRQVARCSEASSPPPSSIHAELPLGRAGWLQTPQHVPARCWPGSQPTALLILAAPRACSLQRICCSSVHPTAHTPCKWPCFASFRDAGLLPGRFTQQSASSSPFHPSRSLGPMLNQRL